MRQNKTRTADEAVELIKDGDTLGVEGSGGGLLEPRALLQAVERRFLATGHPRDLTLVTTTGIGDHKTTGVTYLAHVPLLKRVVAGNWGQAPALSDLAMENKIEAYNFPQGVMAQLYREIAGGRPGLISHVGLHTFIDPRVDGGRLNDVTREPIVRLMELNGSEYLFYPAFPINVAFIRGTTADEGGNLTMEEEAARLEVLAMAQAVHNSHGIVMAQVKRLASAGTLRARDVVVPGILVDHVVVYEDQRQIDEYEYHPSLAGNLRVPLETLPRMALDERKVIARRSVKEIPDGAIVNLGVGMPSGVASVAAEEGKLEQYTMTIEQGLVGGMPAFGDSFGTAFNSDAMIDQPYQFDFYDGGGLDVACLAFAQVDEMGNVNVSKFSGRLIGTGGFVDIAQNTPKIVFCGTLTAGGLRVRVGDARLEIEQEGRFRKFLKRVEHITFNGQQAVKQGQQVLFVTERAVFKAVANGLMLMEIAPGVDLERDILAHLEFTPLIAKPLCQMDDRIFRETYGFQR